MTRPSSHPGGYGTETGALLRGFSVMYPREERLPGIVADGPRTWIEGRSVGGAGTPRRSIDPFDITLHAAAGPDDEERPRCAEVSPEIFFSESKTREAKAICAGCPRRPVCAEDAIERQEPEGIWGGLDPRERRATVRIRARRSLQRDAAGLSTMETRTQ